MLTVADQQAMNNLTEPLVLNSYGNYESGIPYQGNFKTVVLAEMIVKIIFYVIVILLAIAGNLLIIYVVWRNKRLHNTTYYYIVNLAVSDLMVTLFCTWVHLVNDLTDNWVLGAFFCKFNSFSQG